MKRNGMQYIAGALCLLISLFTGGYVPTSGTSPEVSGPMAGDNDSHTNHPAVAAERFADSSVTVQDGDTLIISSFGSDLSYDITEIETNPGIEFTIQYVNDSGMPHNIIFVYSEEDIRPVGIAALQAYENEYIPEGEMDRIFGYSPLVVPNQSVYMTVNVPDEPGVYPYICTYPGHFRSMQGRMIATE